jgi:hypothetical protein
VHDGNKIKHTAPVDVIFLQSPRFFSAIGKNFCPLKFCNKHIMGNVRFLNMDFAMLVQEAYKND